LLVNGSCDPQEYQQDEINQWSRLLGYIKQTLDEQLRPPSGLLLDDDSGLVLLLGQQVSGIHQLDITYFYACCLVCIFDGAL